MKTEITKDRLKEFFYPTKNFYREALDGAIVDYAEIEINPNGIKRFEDNLARYTERPDENAKWWKELTDPKSDMYEHVIAYVHFDAGTDRFNKLFIEVYTAHGCDDKIEVELTDEEKRNIIEIGLESLHKWRETGKIADEEGHEVRQIIEERTMKR